VLFGYISLSIEFMEKSHNLERDLLSLSSLANSLIEITMQFGPYLLQKVIIPGQLLSCKRSIWCSIRLMVQTAAFMTSQLL